MYIIGIDIGGTSIKIGLIDEQGGILEKRGLPIFKDRRESQTETGERIVEEVNSLCVSRGIARDEVRGIGIGCPGFIDAEIGLCRYSVNLQWEDFPLVEFMEKRLHVPVRLANDANAAALGESKFGAAKGKDNVLLLTLGTGVGGGLVLNGKLYEGNRGQGAELGHALLKKDGRPCACGRRGCIESYLSASALIASTKEAMAKHPESLLWSFAPRLENVNGETPFLAAAESDLAAKGVLDQYVEDMGEALLSFINVFWPDIIVLGGGISGQKEALTDPVNAYLRDHAIDTGKGGVPQPIAVVSTLGNDAGILGAAALVA